MGVRMGVHVCVGVWVGKGGTPGCVCTNECKKGGCTSVSAHGRALGWCCTWVHTCLCPWVCKGGVFHACFCTCGCVCSRVCNGGLHTRVCAHGCAMRGCVSGLHKCEYTWVCNEVGVQLLCLCVHCWLCNGDLHTRACVCKDGDM